MGKSINEVLLYKKQDTMFADIILNRRTPSHLSTFTYSVPDNFKLTPGQLVYVPFRKKTLPAIVRQLHEKTPPYPTKLIEEALPLILPKRQMELALWMSEKYGCSFANAINLFVPDKAWELKKSKIKADARSAPRLERRGGQMSVKLLLEKTPLNREKFYDEIIKGKSLQVKGDGAQILLLFPEQFALQKFAKDLPKFHGELSEKEKAEIWCRIKDGEIRVIAGTRPALFLPFKNLKAIVLDFEHSESYSEKRTPKYHAVDVAEKLAEMWKIPLIIISSTPRVKTWNVKRETWDLGEKTEVNIVNMAEERRSGNFSVFADTCTSKIAAALSKNQQILLFINRKGQASALWCRDCGYIFRCDKCAAPLTIHADNNFQCHHCKIKTSMPLVCTKCKNAHLKMLGIGTEGVEKEIKKIFEKASVLRLDSRTTLKMESLEKADILVATQLIDKPISLPRLRLAIAVAPDGALNFPDFRAGYRVFRMLTHIKHLVAGGELYIQTFLPEQKLLECIKNNDIEKFYEYEIATRKNLNLPLD